MKANFYDRDFMWQIDFIKIINIQGPSKNSIKLETKHILESNRNVIQSIK